MQRSKALASKASPRPRTGLHVVAPLKPAAGRDAVRAFTKRLADAMSAESPDRFVATATKSKRKGIFAQSAGLDRRRAVFNARAARRRHIHAARLERTQSRNRAGSFHGHQRSSRAGRARRQSVGGFLGGGGTAGWREKVEAGRVTSVFQSRSIGWERMTISRSPNSFVEGWAKTPRLSKDRSASMLEYGT